jgi:hypothetical protein
MIRCITISMSSSSTFITKPQFMYLANSQRTKKSRGTWVFIGGASVVTTEAPHDNPS